MDVLLEVILPREIRPGWSGQVDTTGIEEGSERRLAEGLKDEGVALRMPTDATKRV